MLRHDVYITHYSIPISATDHKYTEYFPYTFIEVPLKVLKFIQCNINEMKWIFNYEKCNQFFTGCSQQHYEMKDWYDVFNLIPLLYKIK